MYRFFILTLSEVLVLNAEHPSIKALALPDLSIQMFPDESFLPHFANRTCNHRVEKLQSFPARSRKRYTQARVRKKKNQKEAKKKKQILHRAAESHY